VRFVLLLLCAAADSAPFTTNELCKTAADETKTRKRGILYHYMFYVNVKKPLSYSFIDVKAHKIMTQLKEQKIFHCYV